MRTYRRGEWTPAPIWWSPACTRWAAPPTAPFTTAVTAGANTQPMPLTTTTTVISPPVTAVPGRRAGIRLGAEQAGRGPRLVPAATAPVPTAGGDVAPDRGGAAARHRHRCRRAVYRSVTMVGAVGGRAGSLPEPLSDRDFAAHDDSAILGQAEVFGLAGCVLREGEEQPFAPADHAGPVGAAQVDPGHEVGGVVGVEVGFGVLAGDAA